MTGTPPRPPRGPLFRAVASTLLFAALCPLFGSFMFLIPQAIPLAYLVAGAPAAVTGLLFALVVPKRGMAVPTLFAGGIGAAAMVLALRFEPWASDAGSFLLFAFAVVAALSAMLAALLALRLWWPQPPADEPSSARR